MPRNISDPLERAARALCRLDGLPENTKFEGRPMWESFRSKAAAVLLTLKEGDKLSDGLVVKKDG